MTSTPIMRLTTAVLILLSDGPATAAEMAGRINTDQRFAGVLQRLGPIGVKPNQVYAAMSGLRSKIRESKNLIEPVSGRIGEREAYRLTVNGNKAVRDRGLLRERIQPGSEGQHPEPGPAERVNHPPHYGGDTTYEVIKVLEAWGLDRNFCLGNTIKYIARAEHKGATVEDLEKARWYLDREIAKLKGVTQHG